jgi:hypothetical protein
MLLFDIPKVPNRLSTCPVGFRTLHLSEVNVSEILDDDDYHEL